MEVFQPGTFEPLNLEPLLEPLNPEPLNPEPISLVLMRLNEGDVVSVKDFCSFQNFT